MSKQRNLLDFLQKVTFLGPGLTILLPLFVASTSLASLTCSDIFTVEAPAQELVITDPREMFDATLNKPLQIGEGNSGKVYLFKSASGEFMIAKIYKEERKDNLQRDHLGLQLVQRLFDLDSLHSVNFRVAKSSIVENFNNVPGQKALIMPYFSGINLHTLLVSLPANHPMRVKAEKLYQEFIRELDADAVRAHFREELREETDRYFQDHIVDGQKMLIIEGNPRILIKTDNIIFNPVDNTLTLIDPY